MGRALFSLTYPSNPIVHEQEPDPQPSDVPAYSTWSHKNMFDPDSDDFFIDAEYEAFIPTPYSDDPRDQLPHSQVSTSPMAIGDDPATLAPNLRHLWTSGERVFTMEDLGQSWRIAGTLAGDDNTRQDMGIPPALTDSGNETRTFRHRLDSILNPPTEESSLDEENEENLTPSLPSLAELSMPIPIPRAQTPSSGSATPSPPSTPPHQAYSWGSAITSNQAISASISPPPSESPRLYTWSRARYSASPASPSTSRGPFTNPTARASFPRLVASPTVLRA